MTEMMKTLDAAYAELEQIRVSGADVERMYHAKRLLTKAYQLSQEEKTEVSTKDG